MPRPLPLLQICSVTLLSDGVAINYRLARVRRTAGSWIVTYDKTGPTTSVVVYPDARDIMLLDRTGRGTPLTDDPLVLDQLRAIAATAVNR